MMIDENLFFREASLRIFRTLEFETGLKECLKYIKHFMPADILFMNLHDRKLQALRTIAVANQGKAKRTDIIMPLDDNAWEYVRKKEKEKAFIVNQTDVRWLKTRRSKLDAFKKPHSSIVLHLGVNGSIFGALTLLAFGDDRFNDRHLNLFSTLQEPYSVALSHLLGWDELEPLEDRLIEDVKYCRLKFCEYSGSKIIGEASGLKGVMDLVKRVAPTDSPVMLLGETGVGKELIATAIHFMSRRKKGPLIQINCGAIPETLIDSELFGHEKGAFTGAVTQRRGCFERGHGGTLFFDEVGELPLHAQVRLLRVLQEKKIMRVGGSENIDTNVRIIAATHQNLEQMVEDNLFRSDLYFRLNVLPITISPLRERKEDLPELVNHFIEKKAKEMLIPDRPRFSQEDLRRLTAYNWPGNVRELENMIERALILSKNGILKLEGTINGDETETLPFLKTVKDGFVSLDKMTALYIRLALAKTNGKIHGRQGAAELLGINPNTLRSRMKKLGLLSKNSRANQLDNPGRAKSTWGEIN